MQKQQVIEFLESKYGETIYVINKSNSYDDDQYEVVLSLPEIFEGEFYDLILRYIEEDKIELCSWRYMKLPEEEVFVLIIRRIKGEEK